MTNNNTAVKIIDASFALKALRHGGFKELANNIAELIDNSLEAEADNIHIIGTFEDAYSGAPNYGNYNIKSLAVLDDGKGMDETVLQQCLSLGFSNRDTDNLKLGKFGYGLKGATINIAKRIEVFNWRNGFDKAMNVSIDLDDIEKEGTSYIAPATQKALPQNITNLVSKENKTGCCVYITKLDKIKIKTPRGFTKTNRGVSAFATDLSRIFRHFLDNDDEYGRKRNIIIHALDEEGSNIIDPYKLTPNDPMFLLEPNYFVSIPSETQGLKYLEEAQKFKNKATNHFLGEKEIFVRTHDKVECSFKLRKSIADPSIQMMGGKTLDIYEKNTGISFVRSEREIQLDFFNHLAQSEPRHRWWGIEIRFNPDLDEYFGVTHDKQSVLNAKKLINYDARDYSEELEDKPLEAWTKIDYINKFRITLGKEISKAISEMMKIVIARGAGSRRGKTGQIDNKVVQVVNSEIKKQGSDSKSQKKSLGVDEETKIKDLILAIKKEDASVTDEDAEVRARDALNYVINLSLSEWPGSVFLDKKYIANGAMGILNRDHPFFKVYYDYVNEMEDKKAVDALRIVLMAFIRAEDELSLTLNEDDLVKLREKWGYYIEMLIRYAQ